MKNLSSINVVKLLVTCLLFASCATLTGVEHHQKLQEEATFENRLGKLESFTLKSFKDDYKSLQSELRELKKKNGHKAKMNELSLRMEAIRKQIEELENKQP